LRFLALRSILSNMQETIDTPVALLVMCHALNSATLEEYRRIAKAVENIATPRLLLHLKAQPAPSWPNEPIFSFTDNDLAKLGHPRIGRGVIPGNAHSPLLHFFKHHPGYAYYWVVEYDVRFSGEWRLFFESFLDNDADFLTCHIRRYKDEPRWCWWRWHRPEKQIPLPDCLRSFNPIYRISRPALTHLHTCLNDGWCAHFELLMPTLLFHGGFQLADFGGTGEFVPPGCENKFYIDSPPDEYGLLKSGTMRSGPPLARPGTEQNKLYHPVKCLSQAAKFKWFLRGIKSAGLSASQRLQKLIKKPLRRSGSFACFETNPAPWPWQRPNR